MTKEKIFILIGSIILIIAAFMGGMSYNKQLNQREQAAQNQPNGVQQQAESANPIIDNNNTSSPASNPNAPTTYNNINGSYNIYSDGLLPNTLCFFTDTISGKILTGIAQEESICFSNQAEARKLLKIDTAGKLGYPACDQISGKATISVTDYETNPKMGDTFGAGRLSSVTKVISPATCGRGSNQ